MIFDEKFLQLAKRVRADIESLGPNARRPAQSPKACHVVMSLQYWQTSGGSSPALTKIFWPQFRQRKRLTLRARPAAEGFAGVDGFSPCLLLALVIIAAISRILICRRQAVQPV